MSQLKKALEKRLNKEFERAKINDQDMVDMVKRSVARIKEKRRLVKEKGKLYR